MTSTSAPLVSIITPVYNNADHIEECIESVLGQTYTNWEYTIVNNCSTDGSGEIARRYAAKDRRIRVVDTQEFLRAIPNHNRALREMSPAAKYCKIVFSDDWIVPECVARMVDLAERHPSVGIVGAYGIKGHEVAWAGLPYPNACVSGRDVCRLLLLKDIYVFGTATSLLYRADLVRAHDPFFNERNLHSDLESCVVLLKTSDFGFVHQILTFTRTRPESLSALSEDLNTHIAGKLVSLVSHGRHFLNEDEFTDRLEFWIHTYYNFLAVNVLRGRRDDKFWKYHEQKLTETVGFSRARLARAIAARIGRAVLNPRETMEKRQLAAAAHRGNQPAPNTTWKA